MKVGSCFSGIGGLDLGLERAGMTVVWQSEIDPYACRVLAEHWPDVPNLGDVTAIDWSTVERPDLICGGYPCQPFSLAGARGGEADPRHLWPHMRDAIRNLRPRWTLLENVPGHLSLGFGRVLGDLAELGYDCEWDCIPAAAVGAPHLRYRVFVVAHTPSSAGDERPDDDGARTAGERVAVQELLRRTGGDVPNTDIDTVRHQPERIVWSDGPTVAPDDGNHRDVADSELVESGQRGRRQLPQDGDRERDVHHWAVEPRVGRVAHGVPARVDRLRTLGNAVVPQVAELIGRRIMECST